MKTKRSDTCLLGTKDFEIREGFKIFLQDMFKLKNENGTVYDLDTCNSLNKIALVSENTGDIQIWTKCGYDAEYDFWYFDCLALPDWYLYIYRDDRRFDNWLNYLKVWGSRGVK